MKLSKLSLLLNLENTRRNNVIHLFKRSQAVFFNCLSSFLQFLNISQKHSNSIFKRTIFLVILSFCLIDQSEAAIPCELQDQFSDKLREVGSDDFVRTVDEYVGIRSYDDLTPGEWEDLLENWDEIGYRSKRKNAANMFLSNSSNLNDIAVGTTYPLSGNGSSVTVDAHLGNGQYGHVYKITITEGSSEHQFALKQFNTPAPPREFNPAEALDSPYFLKNYGMDAGRKFELTELADSVLDGQFKDGSLTSSDARGNVFRDIFKGLNDMQNGSWIRDTYDLVHWDLKPKNMMVKDGVVQIIDLDDVSLPVTTGPRGSGAEGIRPINEKPKSEIWAAPERRAPQFSTTYGPETDIFSVGTMLLQAKAGEGYEEADLKVLMSRWDKTIDFAYDYEKADIGLDELANDSQFSEVERLEFGLIRDMLKRNPSERPTINQVVNRWSQIHPE